MTDRDEFLEIIGQEFAADVQSTDSLMDGSTIEEWCYCGMREAGVDYEEAFSWKSINTGITMRNTVQALDIIIGIQ